MTEGNFVDYVKIHVSSGNGGKGSTHFHREKYITKGGPDGGDGGRGGHVIVRGDKNLWTLVTFKYKRHFKAEHGLHGSKSRSTGAVGKDLIIPVPLGTLVFDSETGERIAEITSEEDVIVAPGEWAAGEIGISKALQTKRRAMHNQAKRVLSEALHLNLKYWQM